MRQKIEIVQVINPDAIDLERAQERARELQQQGKRIVKIETVAVEQPTLAYIHYEEPDEAENAKKLKGDESK